MGLKEEITQMRKILDNLEKELVEEQKISFYPNYPSDPNCPKYTVVWDMDLVDIYSGYEDGVLLHANAYLASGLVDRVDGTILKTIHNSKKNFHIIKEDGVDRIWMLEVKETKPLKDYFDPSIKYLQKVDDYPLGNNCDHCFDIINITLDSTGERSIISECFKCNGRAFYID